MENREKYLSFVVPCYNSESYMARCIESLLPGGEDVEIIIIDDGSKDKTGEIADAYQKQYPDLVKVIHKENGGHGSGVNAGLACARGVYFKVVDSDDWLDGTAYQKLLEKIRYYCKEAGEGEEKPDLFVCNYVYNHLEQQITRSMGYGNVFPAEKICPWSETGHFLPSQYLVMHALVYRTEILLQSGIVLPEHTFYVDNLFANQPLPFVKIDEPTVSMNFIVNNSPFAGREGKYVTSRNLRDRLFKEIETNVALRVEETDSADTFKVSGRGELHLSILIETMRRQNYEFQVSRPQVITKMIDGKLHEPMEFLIIEVPDTYVGPVMEKLGSRKGELINMGTREGGVTHIEFRIPSRGLMGYRPEFLTDTNGNGIMNHVFDGYEPYKGEIVTRHQGSLIAFETGETVTYGLYAAQERGRLFIGPGVPVYEGMIVGASPKSEDITVNVCKKKHITNTRASGSDDALKLTPPTIMSLEQCLEFIADDELVEVTPENIRMRKRILSKEQRMKQAFRKK